jgi:hypothetical protein
MFQVINGLYSILFSLLFVLLLHGLFIKLGNHLGLMKIMLIKLEIY